MKKAKIDTHGFARPGHGDGFLSVLQDPEKPEAAGQWNFYFKSDQWDHRHAPQFAWAFLPALGKRRYPILRIAASRETVITSSVVQPKRRRPGDAMGSGRPSPVNPQVQVFRPQRLDSVMPDEEGPLNPFRVLHQPFQTGPTPGRARATWGAPGDSGRHLRKTVRIASSPSIDGTAGGTQLTQILGHFQISIEIKDPLLPVTYWYDLIDNDNVNKSIFRMIVLRNSNVRVRSVVSSESTTLVRVHEYEVSKRDGVIVPPIGVPIDESVISAIEDHLDFVSNDSPSGEFKRQLVQKFENVVGITPVVSDIYDGLQFASATFREKTIFGEKVSAVEHAALGAAILLPLSLSSIRAARQIRSLVPVDVKSMISPDLLSELAEEVPLDLIAAAGHMRRTKKSRLLDEAEEILAGRKQTSEAFLKALVVDLSPGYALASPIDRFEALADHSPLGLCLNSDLTIRSGQTELLEGYAAYLQKHNFTSDNVTAADWLIHQPGRSRYADILSGAIGPRYRSILTYIQRGGAAARKIPSDLLAEYQRLSNLGVVTYDELVRLRRSRYGWDLPADHLLEKHIAENDPTIDGIDFVDNGVAMIVPVDQEAALALGDLYVPYVHNRKSPRMRLLVPVDRIMEFEPQQIWDAHVYNYQAMGVDIPGTFGPRLQEQFQLYEEAKNATPLKATAIEYRLDPAHPALRAERFQNNRFWWREPEPRRPRHRPTPPL